MAFKLYRPNSTWTWSFLLVAVVQAIIGLALEGYVFGRYESAIAKSYKGGPPPERSPQTKTIPAYLSCFMFAFLYEIVLIYDALRLKNTIQVIGLCMYNAGILVYAAVQIEQIREVVADPKGVDGFTIDIPGGFWQDLRPFLVTLPCVMAVGTVAMSFVAWKLYDEFAWSIYKHISADLRMKKRFLTYQIYIALLKFDFFFFLSFTVQFLVVITGTDELEKWLTVAAVPVTIILLILAVYWVRRESVVGMLCIIIVFFGAAAYFLFKLIRMYQNDERAKQYLPARSMLTFFAVLTLILVVVTLVVACMCMMNFNTGLKNHLANHQSESAESKIYESEMPRYSQPSTSRMTID